MTRTPHEYIADIDLHFIHAKRKKNSRLSPEWGIWSRQMNLEIRARVEAENPEDPDKTALKYVFNYWVLKSQILEMLHKGWLRGMGKRRKLERQAEDIKLIAIRNRTRRPT